jgi:hypothetical protein
VIHAKPQEREGLRVSSTSELIPSTEPRSLLRRIGGVLIRGARRARKQGARRLKGVGEITRQVRRARKDLYFGARQNAGGRLLLETGNWISAPLDRLRRHRAAAAYIASHPAGGLDPAGGFEIVAFDRQPGFAPVLATCRRLFDEKRAESRPEGFETWPADRQAKFLSRKQSFFRYLLTDDDLRQNPDLVEFALGDSTLGAATRYLRMVPYLSHVDLVYSLPRPGGNIDSQLFHLDPEGTRQVKFFIQIFDVGEPQGPFSFIPADASARVLRDIAAWRRQRGTPPARRYSDEEVSAVGGNSALITVQGPAGTAIAIDTSRCLHLGSRVQPGTFRLMLYLQYCSTREQTNAFDVTRHSADEMRRLAVCHSIERGRARFDAFHVAK